MSKNEFSSVIFDQYQRYIVSAEILNAARTSASLELLEVGAHTLRNLEIVLPNDTITYSDITPRSITTERFRQLDATDMDCEDNAYDFIIALDVFEHIEKEKQGAFLSELIRVARKGVVISAPFAETYVKTAEEMLNEFYRSLHGVDHIWLQEHAENGLPRISLVKEFTKKERISYATFARGSLYTWDMLMKVHFMVTKAPWLAPLANTIYKFYNENVLPYDVSEEPYRKFIFMSRDAALVRTVDHALDAKQNKMDAKTKNYIRQLTKYCDDFHRQFFSEYTQSNITCDFPMVNSTAQYSDVSFRLAEEVRNDNARTKALISELLTKLREKEALPRDTFPSTMHRVFSIVKQNRLFRFAYTLVRPFAWRAYHALRYIRTRFFAQDVKRYHALIKKTEPRARALRMQRKTTFTHAPFISIVVPTYNTKPRYWRDLYRSVKAQTYANWQLCVADGSEPNAAIRKLLARLAKKDARVKVAFLDKNLGIAGNTNAAIALAEGTFVALLDHDDILAPFALYEVVAAINKDPDFDFIYSDEDNILERGFRRQTPYFKPDFSPDLLRSNNYICHFSTIRKSVGDALGWFRDGFDGAQDHDLFLRISEVTDRIHHIPKILYHWRTSSLSVANAPNNKMYAYESGVKAIQDHIERIGRKGIVTNTNMLLGTYRVCYEIAEEPKVSIIILNKDHVDDLSTCLFSIINRSTYRNIEIVIVENNSTEEMTFLYYKHIVANFPVALTIVRAEGAFNFSTFCNLGAKHATGDYFLFMNNDMEVISHEWVEAMLEHAQLPDIGAVGAKLLYPDDTIQHAGVVLGIGGVAGHICKAQGREKASSGFRTQVIQNYSAVTAACVMIRRAVFEEVGGFNEAFAVAFNDVDLCIRIRRNGYRIVYTPYAELYHYESKSRGYEDTPEKQKRFGKETALAKSEWKEELGTYDPYYNPNLTLTAEDGSIRKV